MLALAPPLCSAFICRKWSKNLQVLRRRRECTVLPGLGSRLSLHPLSHLACPSSRGVWFISITSLAALCGVGMLLGQGTDPRLLEGGPGPWRGVFLREGGLGFAVPDGCPQ